MTMLEVARRAGVSQATVSRVVNGAESVSEEVVESVSRAMQELGYKPRQRRRGSNRPDLASSVRKSGMVALNRDPSAAAAKHPGMIALLMLDDSMDSHPTLALAKMRGAEQAVAREGLSLVVGTVGGPEHVPPVLQYDGLIGVLLWGRSISPQLKSALGHLPHAWLSSHAGAQGSRILLGNEQAGRLAAEYLLQCHVKRPAFLSPKTMLDQYTQRGNGFLYALHLAGAEARLVNGDPAGTPFEKLSRSEQVAEVDRLVSQLLQTEPIPDGLFVPDDLFASLVYSSLMRSGVRPGVDLRVVSCGNESSCLSGLHPRPATIDMGPETTGRLAVEQLLREVRDPQTPDRVSMLIEPRLVPGEEMD